MLLTASDGFCLFVTLWALQGLGGGIPACDTTRDAGVMGTGTVLPHCINEQRGTEKASHGASRITFARRWGRAEERIEK